MNLLVVNADGYEFTDFARIGIPLLLVTWFGSLVVLPLFFRSGGEPTERSASE